MDEIYSFYDSIMNIGNKNNKDLIIKVVKEEKSKLLKETNDLSGFCKYIACQIQERLNINNIKSDLIDLKEIVGVDHVILISEYKENNKINRVLIDPTFEQFTKSNNKQLLNLEQWPSEKIGNITIVNDLLNEGITDINTETFNQYINGFSNQNINIDLNKYILDKRMESVSKRRNK